MSAPRTERQASFIESLLGERLATLGAESVAEATLKVHLDMLTVQDAKLVITRLLAMPKDPDPFVPAIVAASSRSGVNNRDGVCYSCGGLVPANGGYYFKQDGLGVAAWAVSHKVGECVVRVAETAVPLAHITEGIYVIDKGNGLDFDDIEEVDVYKVYETRNGHLAAKVLKGYDWSYRTGGVSVVRALMAGGKARLLTHEEAAAFGKLTETCIACGLKLTDDGKGKSVDVGYGPVCAKRYGWPWG